MHVFDTLDLHHEHERRLRDRELVRHAGGRARLRTRLKARLTHVTTRATGARR